MSGRGRGSYRGRGRGGRGSNNSYNHGERSYNRNGPRGGNFDNRNKTEEDRKRIFEPYVAGKQHVDTYDQVKEQIIIQVQKSFKDPNRIVNILREEDVSVAGLTAPTLTKARYVDAQGNVLAGADKIEADLEQNEYNIVFREELRIYNEEKKQLEDNLQKAYALIMKNYCSNTMRNRVEDKPNFEIDVQDKPVELLKVIKEYMYIPTKSKYEFEGLLETMKRFIVDTKQDETEDLTTYTKRFKQARDIFEQSVGKDWIKEFVTHTSDYVTETDNTKKDALIAEAPDQLTAFIFMKNSEQRKYGKLMSNLKEQYALGNNQYPRTLKKAHDALVNHKWDDGWSSHLKNKRKQFKEKRERQEDSPEKSEDNNQHAQLDSKTCYCCGKKGHLAPDCPDREKIKKSDWYMYKAVSAYQNNNNEETKESNNSEKQDNKVKWTDSVQGFQVGRVRENNKQYCCLQVRNKDGIDFKWDSILDTGSSFSSTANAELINDVVVDEKGLSMNTNAGSRVIKERGTMPGLDAKVWTDKTGVANVFSFADIADQYHVTYDNKIEDAFHVKSWNKDKNDINIKFPRDPKTRLYPYRFSSAYINRNRKIIEDDEIEEIGSDEPKIQLLDTVAENRKNFTTAEFTRAKRARTLYHNVGAPGIERFKGMIRTNWIQDCPVIEKDIDIASEIWGPDIAYLKGKTTRRKPNKFIDEVVQIPSEVSIRMREVIIYMDNLYISGKPFLSSITKPIFYRDATPLKDETAETLYKAIDKLTRKLNAAGCTITMIRCDRQFKTLMDEVQDQMNIKMDYSDVGAHESTAERNNRVIEEWYRTALHRLPYKSIPGVMIEGLMKETIKRINMFPATNGISSVFSPSVLLGEPKLHYNKHLRYSLGEYIQAGLSNETTNNNVERTIDGIYLYPSPGTSGGHYFMNLNTGQVMNRQTIQSIPITNTIIQKVEDMANKQGITEVKFHNKKTDLYLPNSDWEFGIEYDEEDDEDYIYEGQDDLAYQRDITDQELQDILEDNNNHIENQEIGNTHNNQTNENEENEENEEDNEDEPDNIDDEDIDPGVTELADQIDKTIDNIIETVRSGDDIDDEIEEEEEEEEMEETPTRPTRSTRNPNPQYNQMADIDVKHNLMSIEEVGVEYDQTEAQLVAMLMGRMNQHQRMDSEFAFIQQHLYHKGIRIFGEKGKEGAMKELKQLHSRKCFGPIAVEALTKIERDRAQQALMYLAEKRDGTIKGRLVYNGKPTREWLGKEESSSPTVGLDSLFLTVMIDGKENRDVMTADIPNAFIQTPIEKLDTEDRIIMKITGVLVDLLVNDSPEIYGSYVVYERNTKVLYVEVLRAIYGMLVSALLFYKKLKEDLEEIGFEFNPYDACVGNRIINGSQHTVRFHVDDLMSSHVDSKVNDEFAKWLNNKYGEYGEITSTRGKVHEYLGMKIIFKDDGSVEIDMKDYVNEMLQEFPIKFKSEGKYTFPASATMFSKDTSRTLEKSRSELFHRFVAKALFLCKRSRLDIQPAVAMLCTRTKSPNETDWSKLVQMMKFLHLTRDDVLTLSMGKDLMILDWYIDASFAVHPDFRSQSGMAMKFRGGKGCPITGSDKQKLNTDSSTIAELVGVHDYLPKVLWTPLFMSAQGYAVESNEVHQDNKSAILLEENGKRSSGKRTRAVNIRYFMITDQVEKGKVKVVYCPTDQMVADFMTKGLQGVKFGKFRNVIMGF